MFHIWPCITFIFHSALPSQMATQDEKGDSGLEPFEEFIKRLVVADEGGPQPTSNIPNKDCIYRSLADYISTMRGANAQVVDILKDYGASSMLIDYMEDTYQNKADDLERTLFQEMVAIAPSSLQEPFYAGPANPDYTINCRFGLFFNVLFRRLAAELGYSDIERQALTLFWENELSTGDTLGDAMSMLDDNTIQSLGKILPSISKLSRNDEFNREMQNCYNIDFKPLVLGFIRYLSENNH